MRMDFVVREIGAVPAFPLHHQHWVRSGQARAHRLERLRCDIKSVRGLPPIELGASFHSSIVGDAISNAVPFSPPVEPSPSGDAILPPAARPLQAFRLLPWMFLANDSHIGTPALEALATSQGLEAVHVIDLDCFAEGSASVLSPEVRWVGATSCPGPVTAAAATLARLAFRVSQRREAGVLEAVLLSSSSDHPFFAAQVLATTLHGHWGMDASEAEQMARVLCRLGDLSGSGSDISQRSEVALQDLRAFLGGCRRRITVVWPYDGSSVEVVGDLVGGWHCRVPLCYNCWRREWRLQLLGVAPGKHRYKFVVDGRWCADLHVPVEYDVWQNANNVLDVREGGGAMKLSDERAAALGAACLAFYTKAL